MDVQTIPVEAIAFDPDNRKAEDVPKLAKSIAAHGLLQPIVVHAIDGGDSPAYNLVAGERRLRAVQELGETEIAAHVLNGEADAESYRKTMQLVENVQRRNLTPMEEARAYARLFELGVTKKDIGVAAGVSTKVVTARLKLADLPTEVQTRADKGEIELEQLNVLAEHATDTDLIGDVVEHMADKPWLDAERAVDEVEHQRKVDAALAELQPQIEDFQSAGVEVFFVRDYLPGRPARVRKQGDTRDSYYGKVLVLEDPKAHLSEPCAIVQVHVDQWGEEPKASLWQFCTKPTRHRFAGQSDVKILDAEAEAKERQQLKEDRAAERRQKAIRLRTYQLAVEGRRPKLSDLVRLVAAGRNDAADAKKLALRCSDSEEDNHYTYAETQDPVDLALWDALLRIEQGWTYGLHEDEVKFVMEWLAPFRERAEAEFTEES